MQKSICRHIEDFIGDLRAECLAPGTINNHIKGVKALFRENGIHLDLPHRLPKRVVYPDRAPTPKELTAMSGARIGYNGVVAGFIKVYHGVDAYSEKEICDRHSIQE